MYEAIKAIHEQLSCLKVWSWANIKGKKCETIKGQYKVVQDFDMENCLIFWCGEQNNQSSLSLWEQLLHKQGSLILSKDQSSKRSHKGQHQIFLRF